MKNFVEMMGRIQSSPYYGPFVRFARPLYDHLGINHVWYYRISHTGNYAYVGTNSAWNEYCFSESLLNDFPCLRMPSLLKPGLSLMKAGNNEAYAQVLKKAWEKFHIHFQINLIEIDSEGVEAFGFGSRFSDAEADERLLNELPLLHCFIQEFRKKHRQLILFAQENEVNLPGHMGSTFYERPRSIELPLNRRQFLKEFGFSDFLHLSQREREILRFLANGFPASYIKEHMHLGLRTVENYIASIKMKLSCQSKVDLIQKAQEALLAGLFKL